MGAGYQDGYQANARPSYDVSERCGCNTSPVVRAPRELDFGQASERAAGFSSANSDRP